MRAAVFALLTITAVFGARADTRTLLSAQSAADVASLLGRGEEADSKIIAAAADLGVATAIEVFVERTKIAFDALTALSAAIIASPRDADAMAAVAAVQSEDASRIVSIARVACAALKRSDAPAAEIDEELIEIAAVLVGLAPPEFHSAIAEAIAQATPDPDDDAFAILARLRSPPAPAATARPFGDERSQFFVVTPSSAAQDAPSAN